MVGRVTFRHARLLPVPEADSLGGARLEAIYSQDHGRRRDVLVDYQALVPQTVEMKLRRGRPYETIKGLYVPRRLRLWDVRQLNLDGLYARLDSVPPDHPARDLRGILFFRAKEGGNFCLLSLGAEPAGFLADARYCIQEERGGKTAPVVVTRDWSPSPASPARLVPDRQRDINRYGGNPVSIRLGNRVYHRRLFIGSLEMQDGGRPRVDSVLNLGEEPAAWLQEGQSAAADRWAEQGEGSLGMSLVEIAAEAAWVLEKLRRGQRVLVHCLAGMNRSATVCTAVLIQLERLGAEAALERVRQNHPWARPDSYHWLRLRWMAHLLNEKSTEIGSPAG